MAYKRKTHGGEISRELTGDGRKSIETSLEEDLGVRRKKRY